MYHIFLVKNKDNICTGTYSMLTFAPIMLNVLEC